jgi:hypothetical protein
MKRTQLYLQEDLWKLLHIRSRQQGRSISDLVRDAIQEKYGMSREARRDALRGIVGLWKDRDDLPGSTRAYVRELRRGKRLGRIKR